MNHCAIVEDLQALAQRYLRWNAENNNQMDFKSYLYNNEPKRADRLWKLFKFVESLHKEERD